VVPARVEANPMFTPDATGDNGSLTLLPLGSNDTGEAVVG
jgi:hypothetical protein